MELAYNHPPVCKTFYMLVSCVYNCLFILQAINLQEILIITMGVIFKIKIYKFVLPEIKISYTFAELHSWPPKQ
jgi:hypothetical protein